jgi:hypothetical protein
MNAQVLKEAIQGFYQDYTTSRAPAGLMLAPPSNLRSVQGQFLYRRSDNSYDARTDLGAGGFGSEFRPGNTDLGVESVSLKSYKAPYEVIPYSIARSVEDQVSLVEPIVNGQLGWIHGQYVTNLFTAAAALTAGTALNLTTDSADVAGILKENVRAIQIACNERPNVIYMSPEAVDRFLKQDQVFNGTALAAAASPTVQRRTGAQDEVGLAAWFKNVLGLQLLVEDLVGINTSGTRDFIAGNTAILAVAKSGVAESCFKTFHQYADLAEFEVAETQAPMARGQIVTCEAIYDVKITDPARGLKIALTLS